MLWLWEVSMRFMWQLSESFTFLRYSYMQFLLLMWLWHATFCNMWHKHMCIRGPHQIRRKGGVRYQRGIFACCHSTPNITYLVGSDNTWDHADSNLKYSWTQSIAALIRYAHSKSDKETGDYIVMYLRKSVMARVKAPHRKPKRFLY